MAGKSGNGGSKSSNDNRSRQLNREHDAYWQSRGEPGRPDSGGGGTPPAPAQEGEQKPE
jgi:hypothetical protein